MPAPRAAFFRIRTGFSPQILLLLCAASIAGRGSEIVQWGDSSRGGSFPGPTNPPAGLTNAAFVAAGFYHCLALTADGKVVAWGNSNYGQTNVPPDLTNVVACAAGASHNLAVTSDGRVHAWGGNFYGETDVPAGLSNVVQVSAGEYHSVALQADGRVVAWGNFFNGVTNDPAMVPAGLSNCITIASGASQALGITPQGTVIVWGSSRHTNPPPDLTNAVEITSGRDVSIALTVDGRLKLWPDSELTNIANEVSNVVQVSMERLWCVALTADGQLRAWGQVTPGLDYGETNVPPGLANVAMVAAGRYHGIALIDADAVAGSWSMLAPRATANGTFLDVPTRRGRLYVLESSPSLGPGSWSVQRRFAGDGAVQSFNLGTNAQGFFRARRVP